MNENRHDRMPSHKIDELFKSAIDSAEQAPAPEIWDDIEKKLDQYNIINIKRKYANLKGIAVALVLLLFTGALYEFQLKHNSSQTANAAHSGIIGSSLVKNSPSGKKNTENKATGTTYQAKSFERSFSVNANSFSLERTNSASGFNENTSNQALYKSTESTLVINGKGLLPEIKKVDNAAGSREAFLFSSFPSPAGVSLNETSYINQRPDLDNASSSAHLSASDKNSGSSWDLSGGSSSAITLGAKQPRFSLTLIFSPDFTSRVVKADWQVNSEDNKDEIRKSERYAFSYSVGALIDYNLNNHWSIESGITLSDAVLNIEPKFIFARPDNLGEMKYKFNSSNGYSYLSSKTVTRPAFGDSMHASRSFSSLQYVSFPVAFKYKFGRNKLNFNATAGISANFLVKDKIETFLTHGGNEEIAINRDIKGLKPVYYNALLSAGASYNFNKTWAVSLTPTARLALTSINTEAPVKSYQQSIGLVAGVQFNF